MTAPPAGALVLAGLHASAHAHPRRRRPAVSGAIAFRIRFREQGIPMPEIAAKLTITTGTNAGGHPSVSSL